MSLVPVNEISDRILPEECSLKKPACVLMIAAEICVTDVFPVGMIPDENIPPSPELSTDLSTDALLVGAHERLLRLARRMKRDYPNLGRWEQTEDVLQNALIRLYRALKSVQIQSSLHFHRMAALQIRRELIDLCRHYQGEYGVASNHATWIPGEGSPLGGNGPEPGETTGCPQELAEWSDFHRIVDALPEEDREVFDLLWYSGMSQAEAAATLNISLKTIQRRWRGARLKLAESLESRPAR